MPLSYPRRYEDEVQQKASLAQGRSLAGTTDRCRPAATDPAQVAGEADEVDEEGSRDNRSSTFFKICSSKPKRSVLLTVASAKFASCCLSVPMSLASSLALKLKRCSSWFESCETNADCCAKSASRNCCCVRAVLVTSSAVEAFDGAPVEEPVGDLVLLLRLGLPSSSAAEAAAVERLRLGLLGSSTAEATAVARVDSTAERSLAACSTWSSQPAQTPAPGIGAMDSSKSRLMLGFSRLSDDTMRQRISNNEYQTNCGGNDPSRSRTDTAAQTYGEITNLNENDAAGQESQN